MTTCNNVETGHSIIWKELAKGAWKTNLMKKKEVMYCRKAGG